MLKRKIKTNLAPALSSRDLALAIHGAWHPAAGCEGSPTVLWDARVRPDYLRMLWSRHRAIIEQAAAEAGVDEPWITARLYFIDALDG